MEVLRAIFILLLFVGFMQKVIGLITGDGYPSDPCPSGLTYCDGE